VSPRATSWIVAAAIALPFALALPAHVDPDAPWLEGALWALVVGIFFAAAFAARRVALLEGGRALAGGFAALYLVLALLDVARTERYAFPAALTDLALVFIAFYGTARQSRRDRERGLSRHPADERARGARVLRPVRRRLADGGRANRARHRRGRSLDCAPDANAA
jgi:hypothetical protein